MRNIDKKSLQVIRLRKVYCTGTEVESERRNTSIGYVTA